MSNLGHFKLAVIAFSLGLLGLVSQVAEDGDDASTIEVAAASVIDEVNQKQRASVNPWAKSTLGVSQFGSDGHTQPTVEAYRPATGTASTLRSGYGPEGAGSGTSALPPPTPEMIHK